MPGPSKCSTNSSWVVMRKQMSGTEMEIRTLESDHAYSRMLEGSIEDGVLRMRKRFAMSNLIERIKNKKTQT